MKLLQSELYLIYKRKIYLFYSCIVFIAAALMCVLYIRYNIIYPNKNDLNHLHALNLMSHSMLENTIFHF
ncbi:hypothetical protein [Fluviispira vulneris]|uniref:hypothetical protein n=1 Tax=Fluviispira vulneris TaxID=2763012 RepID=UPI001648E27D|nr:hypothetical protein [Fluviispira vulneris]